MSKTRILQVALCVAAIVCVTTPSATAKAVRCDQHHPRECAKLRHRMHKLQAAVAWQKHERDTQVQAVLDRTRGAQPFAYAAHLAYLACVAFRGMGNPDCRPPSEMLAVGRCESGLQVNDPNPASTASNWMQYLDSTWQNAPAGRLGFYKLDVLAVAIQSEAKATSGWHEWLASAGCHGLS